MFGRRAGGDGCAVSAEWTILSSPGVVFPQQAAAAPFPCTVSYIFSPPLSPPPIPPPLSPRIADKSILRFSALDTDSNSDHAGELICHKAFPIEPLGFWPLPGYGFDEAQVVEAKKRFKDSYFKGDKGIWYHGD